MKKIFRHPFAWGFALLLTLLYFALPLVSDWLTSKPVYAKYAGSDAARITNYVQSVFVYPFQKVVKGSLRNIVIFPYWLILGWLVVALWLRFPKFWKAVGWLLVSVYIFIWLFPNTLLWFENDKASKSYGSVANGRIVNSKRIAFQGANFTTYSFWCYLLGRTFVHQKVRKTLDDTFKILEKQCPEITFVVGETGTRRGGHFPPHRTHRNGLSVDIMTPLLKKKPTTSHHLFNIWGYGLEFDNKGKKGNLEIDYETTALLLDALQTAAAQNDLRIQKVIFDPVLRPNLFKTKTGSKIQNLPYTKNRVIIRHDDHLHIDFALK